MPNQVDMTGVLGSLNVVRFVDYSLVDINGTFVGGIPSFNLATMPDATSVSVGSCIHLPRSEFYNSGGGAAVYMPPEGIVLKTDGNVWKPAFKQVLAVIDTGTEATPILSGVTGAGATTAFSLAGGSPSIPGELLYSGLRINLEMVMGKGGTSTAGTIPVILFGSSSTLANNSQAAKGETIGNAATLRQAYINSFVTVTPGPSFSGPIGDPSAGSALIPNAGATNNQNAGVEGFRTYTTALSNAAGAKNYISPGFFATGVTDTHSLYYFRVTIE